MKSYTNVSITLALTLGLAGGALADAHKEAPAGAKKAPEAAKKMEMPKPPAEVEALAKQMAGTWKCAGKAAEMDGKTMSDMKVAMTMKLDMNKWWISGTLNATGKMPFKASMFTTYDVPSKKWYRVMVDNWGASETSWSSGAKDGKVVWDGEGRSAMGVMKVRTTEEVKGPKEVHMKGEGSMDSGKTWMTLWEAGCKK